jgi:Mitochondrial degradasome RNA helicase subunit C terminal
VNWMRYFASELSQRGVVRLGLRLQQSARSDASAAAHSTASTVSTSADSNSATSCDGELTASSHSDSSSNGNSSSSDSVSSSSGSSNQQQSAKQLRYTKRQEQKRSAPRTPGQLLELETQHKILDLYIWLGTRNKREFVDLELAKQGALGCSQAINVGLANMLPPAPPAAARSRKAMLRDCRASTAASFSAKSTRKGSKGRKGGGKREREAAVSFL